MCFWWGPLFVFYANSPRGLSRDCLAVTGRHPVGETTTKPLEGKGPICNNCTSKNESCSPTSELEPYTVYEVGGILLNVRSVIKSRCVLPSPPPQTSGSSGRLQERCSSTRQVQHYILTITSNDESYTVSWSAVYNCQCKVQPATLKTKAHCSENVWLVACQTPLRNCSI